MFKIGDKVTSDFQKDEALVVRKITKCEPNYRYGSGFVASADGGEPCPHCGHAAQEIFDVDAAWFEKHNQED